DDDRDAAERDDGEEAAVSAKPVERRRARARAAQTHDDHAHDDGHDGHGHDEDDDDDAGYEDEDPNWWTPYAVMTALVLVGLFGFFGVFNKLAARFVGPMPQNPSSETPAATVNAVAAKAPTPAPPGHPGAPGMQQREIFGAKHLLVMYKGSRRAPPNIERTKEQAKARAEEAAKKAKAGAKFEDLVKEYSDEPGAGARGGDLGRFPKGAMVPEFQAALDKLKVGEVSGVVETPFGYHVILRTQ
ncbi:MAG TPA: peptidylprolyl isomerase, partial [Minicystis sp.]|nr:peptidylprolyl isomerase [Minicystis sp.]